MDFDLPGDDDPRRVEIRRWLADHPDPSGTQLAEAGFVAPHWPLPWGFGADPVHQIILEQELEGAGVSLPDNPIGIGWAGPTILLAASEEQKQRWLPPLLSGEEFWCQLFSEPEAGSDLAAVSTRAVRDGDEYVINGQKLWTTWAERSTFGILLARTNPDAPKRKGISYFVCPMDLPGIEIRPVIEMTGGRHFNEVFFDDVRIPADHLLGAENDGWRLAVATLASERVSLSTGGALWGMGPTTADLLDLVRRRGGCADPLVRQRLARAFTDARVIDLLGFRLLTAMANGQPPGPEASVKKLLADEHGQRLMNLAKDLTGTAGLLSDTGPMGTDPDEWPWGFLFAPALTIGGGTAQVQRNIIAERVLGLPRDPD